MKAVHPTRMPPSCMTDEGCNSHAKKDSLGDEGIVHGHIHNYDNMTLIHGHVHRTSLGAGDAPVDRSFLSKGVQGVDSVPPADNGAQSNEKCFNEGTDNTDCQFFQFVNYHQGGKGNEAVKNGANGRWTSAQPKSSLGHLYNDEALLLPSSKRKLSHGAAEENCYCPPKVLEICCDADHITTPASGASGASGTETPDIIPRAINRDELRRYKKNRKQSSKSGIDSFANLNLNHFPANDCEIPSNQVLENQDLEFEDEENDDENIFEKFCEECLNFGHDHQHGVSSSPENLESSIKSQGCCHHHHHQHHHDHHHVHTFLPRENSSTTLSSTQSANSEVEFPSERETCPCADSVLSVPPLATKKYPHHVMNSQIDLQILDDLCNISSLYEVPFANHMNHHNHHSHSHEDERNRGINLLESSIKGDSSYASASSCGHNHHHHRIQLQNCTTDCQPVNLNQINGNNPINDQDIGSSWNNKNYSFERSTIPKTESPVSADLSYQTQPLKTEEFGNPSQEPTIAFNWQFKKDENAIQCKWDQCPETFSSLIDLQKHMLRDHVADKDASCYWIPCTFKGEDTCSLINHINSDHGINFGLNIAQPDTCTKPMPMGQYWLPPGEQSSPVKPEDASKIETFQCKWGDCTAVLDSAASLTKHLEGHLDRGKSEYQCLWCGCNRKFAQRQKLVRHLKVHSGYKPHKCQVCGKCFSNEDTLTQHMRIHSGEKPFGCHICGKRFAVSSSLKIHIRTHTGEKPLQCKICGKRFSESSNLSKHMKCHKKKYNCTHCKRGFDTIEKFQAHEARCFKKSK